MIRSDCSLLVPGGHKYWPPFQELAMNNPISGLMTEKLRKNYWLSGSKAKWLFISRVGKQVCSSLPCWNLNTEPKTIEVFSKLLQPYQKMNAKRLHPKVDCESWFEWLYKILKETAQNLSYKWIECILVTVTNKQTCTCSGRWIEQRIISPTTSTCIMQTLTYSIVDLRKAVSHNNDVQPHGWNP